MKKFMVAAVAMLGATGAQAADIEARALTKAPPMAAISNWTGFYAGINAGYGWGGNTVHGYEAVPDPSYLEMNPFDAKSHSGGFIGGAQAGYNWQSNRWVFGIEADFSYSNVDQSTHYGPLSSPNFSGGDPTTYNATHQRMDWFATVRSRIGITATDSLLIYATGGLAAARANSSTLFFFGPSTQYPAADTATLTGWTAGGGLEWKIDTRWSAKTEYLYYDLGSRTLVAPTHFPDMSYNSTIETRGHIVRVGLNYGL